MIGICIGQPMHMLGRIEMKTILFSMALAFLG
jgi:hypothetical protein